MKAKIIVGDIKEEGNMFNRIKQIYEDYNENRDIEIYTNNPNIVDLIDTLYDKNVEVYIQKQDKRILMDCSIYVFEYLSEIYEVISSINIDHKFGDDDIDEVREMIEEKEKNWR